MSESEAHEQAEALIKEMYPEASEIELTSFEEVD